MSRNFEVPHGFGAICPACRRWVPSLTVHRCGPFADGVQADPRASALVSAACEATERFTDDQLEAHATGMRRANHHAETPETPRTDPP